jgi:CHAT domain-containing protein/tetratricopeptide (TPR) repeat protein
LGSATITTADLCCEIAALKCASLAEAASDSAQIALAAALNDKGDFAEAAELYRQLIKRSECSVGLGDPRAVNTAVGLSLALSNLGDYIGAESVLRRCLAATRRTRGEKHGLSGWLMLNLADVLAERGQHVESTELYRQAAVIVEAFYGLHHTRMAKALSGLAHTVRRGGKSGEAAELYRRCVRIIEQNHPKPHPDVLHYRSRLGMCLFESGQRDEGIRSVERAIADAVALYGEDSYQAALERRQLGLLLVSQKKLSDAYEVLTAALITLERFFGPDHPYLSKCLKGLARLCEDRGELDQALSYLTRAVSIHEDVSGRDQLELAHLLRTKTVIELDAQRWDEAVATAIRGTKTALAVQDESLQISSNDEAILLTTIEGSLVRRALSAVVANPDRVPDQPDSTLARVFVLVVRTHGRILDWLAHRQRFLETVSDTVLVEPYREAVTAATQRLADLIVQGPGDDRQIHRDELIRARHDKEEAERNLSRIWNRSRTRGDTVAVTVDRLASALDPGATLVHFIRFPRWLNPKWTGRKWYRSHYGAFRLKKNDVGAARLRFVDLGPAAQIDSLIAVYRNVIAAPPPGRRPSAKEEAEFRSVAQSLYELVWAPLMPPGARTGSVTIGAAAAAKAAPFVLIVPSVRLWLVDFNTLLAETGEAVIERWRLHTLSSALDLFREPTGPVHGEGMVAVGNPTRDSGVASASGAVDATGRVSRAVLCAEAYQDPRPLPGAELEARTVARFYAENTGQPATVLLGSDADEARVKQLLPGKRLIHLAAHGFACSADSLRPASMEDRLVDPLVLSGIVLAPDGEGNDGLLTAQEVTCLDLSGADWVVLSACGSGLGRLIGTEGVFGLRRAFELAGARTVVMALWRIDDNSVRELMTGIYTHRLSGMSTADAIRQAQLERLHDQRRRLNRVHPALWGGIIAEGDWR